MSSVWRDCPGLGGLTGSKVVLLFGDQRRKAGGYSISEIIQTIRICINKYLYFAHWC